MPADAIQGFLEEPQLTVDGQLYAGRLTCHAVQWTGESEDTFATFTLTARQVADAAESRLIWTDQDVQRGIQPGLESKPPRELPVGDGYPDPDLYVFRSENADDICEKLLRGDRLFLNPLVWNLRPGTFQAYWEEPTNNLHLYTGRIYLPDSHHRQQAILKAVRLYREDPSAYPKFNLDKQFKVELYFLTKEDEGNYFFDKNQRPRPTAKSKAFDLTTVDDLSVLAKRVIEKSASLQGNVNRVTDRLITKNPQVVTLSTLREMMRTFAPADALDEVEVEGLATVAAEFYELLVEVRPELGHLDLPGRRRVRNSLIVDAAVMMHAYSHLMRDFNAAISTNGMSVAQDLWRKKLNRLSATRIYTIGPWEGDLFSRNNPLWERLGVIKTRADGGKTVMNTGGARSSAGRALQQLLRVSIPSDDLSFLAT